MANTLRSHCLMDYAASISDAKQNELAEVLFHGHFTEGNTPSNSDFLLKVAEQVREVIFFFGGGGDERKVVLWVRCRENFDVSFLETIGKKRAHLLGVFRKKLTSG